MRSRVTPRLWSVRLKSLMSRAGPHKKTSTLQVPQVADLQVPLLGRAHQSHAQAGKPPAQRLKLVAVDGVAPAVHAVVQVDAPRALAGVDAGSSMSGVFSVSHVPRPAQKRGNSYSAGDPYLIEASPAVIEPPVRPIYLRRYPFAEPLVEGRREIPQRLDGHPKGALVRRRAHGKGMGPPA